MLMKRNIILLVALSALLLGMPLNADVQSKHSKSRTDNSIDHALQNTSSSTQTDQKVDEYNLLALYFVNYHKPSRYSYRAPDINAKGIPLYYKTGKQHNIINVIAYKPVLKFGETVKGDTAWVVECSYENGRLKNVKYRNGNVDIYRYDAVGRLVSVTKYESDGSHKEHISFRMGYDSFSYCYSFKESDGEWIIMEKKDDGYYRFVDDYYYGCGTDRDYGSMVSREIYKVNPQSGLVSCDYYWRYKDLTVKGRLAGKKYNWHYCGKNSDRTKFDMNGLFLPDKSYIIEYEQVL